eukprot:9492258-Pyramimonas_sp.AAC.1
MHSTPQPSFYICSSGPDVPANVGIDRKELAQCVPRFTHKLTLTKQCYVAVVKRPSRGHRSPQLGGDTSLHYTTLHYTTLHYTTLHYTTLHYTLLHYTTLHYTTLHYATPHYTTLLYTATRT